MSFQGDGFQGNAFQVGMPGEYPWTPATTTSYIEGLPDRTRIVFYQALAAAPSPPQAATTTPTTAGLQDGDKIFRGRFLAPQLQFATFTQNDQRAATPITAGLQDFDLMLRRRRAPLPPDVISAYPQPVVTIFETEGFDDFDPLALRRPRLPPQDITFTSFAQTFLENEGWDDFDVMQPRRRRLALGDITFTPFVQAFYGTKGFDEMLAPRARRSFWDITTAYPPFGTATPITAGVEPIFGPLVKRPYLDQQYATFPINTTIAAQTPITAGLQDFDYRFRYPFRPPQFSDFIVNDSRAGTPITAGIQDFDRFSFRLPSRLRDFGAQLVSQITAIAAGIQGFEAPRRPMMARDQGQGFAGAPATASTAGTQGLDAPARQRRPLLDQVQSIAVTTAATVTPITAGLQNLDFTFKRPFRPALQQVTSFGPTVITIAITPGPFQFALASLPPFHYGMKVSLQTFESRGQNVGIRIIVHRPSRSALLTPQTLLGTKGDPTLTGTQGQPGLGGEVEED